MPEIKLAKFRTNLLSLAVLAAFYSQPVHAEEPSAGVQMLEWSGNTPGDTPDNESTPEATSTDDVWQRIRSGFKIDDDASKNPLVALHESWYAARPEYVRRMIERSRRYLFHIVQEVDRRAMPMEIALLPMVESAFNPTAESPAAASGIWQFMPSTGRLYGLKQDAWYDGRRDFPAATEAALDYLGKLYLDFGDWELALAAYNCGEGCVTRAIQKNVQQGLPTDYASLTLPNETRHYVPKLLAIRNLVNHPERYGIAIDTLPNQPYFNQVTVHAASMDIRSAARLAGMSRDEFVALNAAFPRKLIHSDTPVNLLVPVDKADAFQRNLETGSWDSWQPYTARKGERPEAIAKRVGVSLARLEEHNLFHLKRGKLERNQTILVPVRNRSEVVGKNDTDLAAPPSQIEVQHGDTLFGIALRNGLTVAELGDANPGLNGRLTAGQTLRLPTRTEAGPGTAAIQPVAYTPRLAKSPRPAHYTARRGDTLSAIAQRFDISLAEIRTWNPVFKKRSTVRAGQTVTVRKP